MKTIGIVLSENFHFLMVTFSVQLNRHIFVMVRKQTFGRVRPANIQVRMRIHTYTHSEYSLGAFRDGKFLYVQTTKTLRFDKHYKMEVSCFHSMTTFFPSNHL